jgi:Fur family transcriptional regulator, ferric uptake regulator
MANIHRKNKPGRISNTLAATLRKSGFKATPNRLAILEIFNTLKRPLSAQEIIDLLPHSTDQATIYRTLRSFKAKGLICQIDLRHNHAHYELTNLSEHHHLICIRCGRMEDVHHCNIENIEKTILADTKHFSEIRQHSLEFYGVCKACAKKPVETEVPSYRTAPL